jgi:hypothetical protein
VACLPLLAGGQFKPANPVMVTVTMDQQNLAPNPSIVAARLSAFTPALWCQFTQDSSRIYARPIGSTKDIQTMVASLAAAPDSTGKPVLKLHGDAANGSQATDLARLTTLQASSGSQIQDGVAVVVTQYVTDAFAQLREEPTAVYEITQGAGDNQTISLTPTWRN